MDDYEYRPLNAQTRSIRLLRLRKGGGTTRIEGEIFHTVISDHNTIPYEALSYTWGNVELTYSIEVENQRLWITENLYSALQCLRGDQDRILWIDAICINQSDKEERSQQVLEMSKIFGSARTVIFWLGRPTAEAIVFLESLDQLQANIVALSQEGVVTDNTSRKELWLSLQQTLKSQNSNRLDAHLDGLKVLLKRPWFERVWILQEVFNARSAIICSGSLSVSADIFALSPSLLGFNPNLQVQSVLDMMPGCAETNSQYNHSKDDLINLLTRFRASKATDKRDLIFALLGMSSEPLDHTLLRPDYTKSFQEVVANTIRYWFESTTTTISQVLDCLAGFETVRVTCLIPLERATDSGEIVQVRFSSENVLCTRESSSFLVEDLRHEDSKQEDTFHAELDRLQTDLGPDKITDKAKYKHILHIASWQGSQQRVKLLVVKEAKEALLLLASYRCRRILSFVAERSTDDKPELLQNALFTAADRKHWDLVQLLIDEGVDINAQSRIFGNALQIAILQNNLKAAKMLLDNGADIHAEGGEYGNALCMASLEGKVEMVVLLLDKGADVNAQGGRYGNALQAASCEYHEQVVQLLLERGANARAEGGEFGSALMAVLVANNEKEIWHGWGNDRRFGNDYSLKIRRSQEHIVQQLLDRGADFSTQKETYGRALIVLSVEGDEKVLRMILEKGAGLNAQQELDEALLNASRWGRLQIVQSLLEHGANVNAENEIGVSALSYAAGGRHNEIVKLLLKNGAVYDA